MAGISVGRLEDLSEDEGLLIEEERTGTGDGVAVFRVGDDVYAIDDTCSHEKASLAEGWLEDCEVECPLHSARFSLTTGEALCMPATEAVRTHRVEVRDGEVWVFPGERPAS